VLAERKDRTLIEARPLTGRTHQIRVHLQSAGCPVLGDALYGQGRARGETLALRAIELGYSMAIELGESD
jgi:23S rRNA-/tRNA-specific pseudouridylate synthase